MAIKNDLTGQEYGRLKVLGYAGKNKHGASLWLCKCSCGTVKIINSGSLRRKTSPATSCGCYSAEMLKAGRERHGKSRTREYRAWQDILQRCNVPTSSCFDRYGARGIKVCDRWQGKDGFANFYADMGERPSPKHSIDRFPDNDGNYEPGNCRWATSKQQMRNTRQNTYLEHRGERKTMAEWCEILGIKPVTLSGRIAAGWTAREALETPISYAVGCKAGSDRKRQRLEMEASEVL